MASKRGGRKADSDSDTDDGPPPGSSSDEEMVKSPPRASSRTKKADDASPPSSDSEEEVKSPPKASSASSSSSSSTASSEEEKELLAWVKKVLSGLGRVTNLTTDWTDGNFLGLLCQKLAIFDEDIEFMPDEDEENWGTFSLADEHLADELDTTFNIDTIKSLRAGKGALELFKAFRAYSIKHAEPTGDSNPSSAEAAPRRHSLSQNDLHVRRTSLKRASTMVKHEDTYGEDDRASEMTANPLLTAAAVATRPSGPQGNNDDNDEQSSSPNKAAQGEQESMSSKVRFKVEDEDSPPDSPIADAKSVASKWETASHAESTTSSVDDQKWFNSDVPVISRMVMACGEGRLDVVKKIFTDEPPFGMGGDRKLLNGKREDDNTWDTPLVKAAWSFSRTPKPECYDICEWLLHQKVALGAKVWSGETALHLVVQGKQLDPTDKLFTLFMKYSGKDEVNAKSNTDTSILHYAAISGISTRVQALIMKGAEIDAQNSFGVTPLHFCAIKGHPECLKIFVEYGANPNQRDYDGWDALYIAKNDGHQNVVDLLDPLSESCLKDKDGKPFVVDKGRPRYPINKFFKEEFEKHGKVTSDKEIDEMKIQTMFKMVDECRVSTEGKDVIKKVVYLTNTQASKFDEDMMGRFLSALDIGEPKFVIKLIDSEGIASQMRLAHPEKIDDPTSLFGSSTFNSSEISSNDERVVEQQILLFMKSCVLPLALQTKALIIVSGSNDCYLTAALARVAVQEQARYGKNCPFTVIATASEIEVHAKAVSDKACDASAVAQQIARASPTWARAAWPINEVYTTKKLRGREKLPKADLTPAAECYIIFESYDPPQIAAGERAVGELNNSPQKQFETTLLQYLTRKLPCVAITALKATHGNAFVMDLANRGIPILMLDATERAFTLEKHESTNEMHTDLAKETDAFPMVSAEFDDIIKLGENLAKDSNKDSDASLPLFARLEILEVAKQMMERKMRALEGIDKNFQPIVPKRTPVVDVLSISRLAFFHTVVNAGNNVGKLLRKGAVPLFQRILDLEKIEKTNRDKAGRGPPVELVNEVMRWLYSRYTALKLRCEYKKVKDWLEDIPQKYLRFRTIATTLFWKLEKPYKLLNNSSEALYQSDEIDQSEWVAQRDLLVSSHVFSASLFDLDEAKRILGTVAKIDRLPTSNSLQALRIIQDGKFAPKNYRLHRLALQCLTIPFVSLTIVYSSLGSRGKVSSNG